MSSSWLQADVFILPPVQVTELTTKNNEDRRYANKSDFLSEQERPFVVQIKI